MNCLENMDEKMLRIVREYNYRMLGCENNTPFGVLIVWKCPTIQNWKYLIITTLPDNKYYEVTYNGDKEEFYLEVYEYLDVYEKQDEKIISLNDIDK